MLKIKNIILPVVLTFLALLLCDQLHGQDLRTNDIGRGNFGDNPNMLENMVGANPFEDPNQTDLNQTDSTKQRKPRKPLESYFFNDSIRSMPNFTWTADMWENRVRMGRIDSMLNDFQTDLPFMRHGVGDIYVGNLGASSMPIDFHARQDFQDFQMAQTYYAYIYTPQTAPFYNVKLPLTQLGYITAGQKRYAVENLSIIHAQNVTPATGFNFSYKQPSSKGTYQNQATKQNNMSLAVSHTGKQYSIHAGYINNRINNRSNGGLVYDEDLGDIEIELPQNYNVRLKDAHNWLKNNTLYAVQSYGLPLRRLTEEDFTMANHPAIYVGHAIEWTRWTRLYTDTRSGSQFNMRDDYAGSGQGTVRDYYENWYLDPRNTRDSLAEDKLSNRVFVQLQPWDRDGVIGTVNAGIGMDNHRYYQFDPNDYITGRNGNVWKNSFYVYGSVEGKFRRYFDWGGSLRFVPAGYRIGDMEAEANARMNVFFGGKPVSLSGKFSYSRREPAYWSQTYISNHFRWSNSFDKENITRFDVALEIPDINAEVRLNQSLMTDKVYYNQNVLPAQQGGVVSVTGVYARKDFRIGGFHFNHRVLLQWSTNDQVVPVPFFTAYLSYFFEFNVVRDVLKMRIGLDGRYNTSYYAPGFNPAALQFYNQREKQVGGFPMVDAFITAKWKRFRILLKYEHANESLLGNEGYFSVLHYPLNQPVFKMGISWNFYD